jgi:hypothetical protein
VLQAAESLLLAHEDLGDLPRARPGAPPRHGADPDGAAGAGAAAPGQPRRRDVRPLDVEDYLREHAALVLAGLRSSG